MQTRLSSAWSGTYNFVFEAAVFILRPGPGDSMNCIKESVTLPKLAASDN